MTYCFDIDYYVFIGDEKTDKKSITHNKNAKQETVKTHRGDLWSSDFNSPDSQDIAFVNAWLVKTKHDGLKVKNNELTLNGKSAKLKIDCPSENSCFSGDFAIHLSNSLKKGTYQVVYRAIFDTYEKWY